MAELRSPFDGGVIEVSDDLVDRYKAAGWVDKPKRQTRKKADQGDDE